MAQSRRCHLSSLIQLSAIRSLNLPKALVMLRMKLSNSAVQEVATNRDLGWLHQFTWAGQTKHS